MSLKIRRCGLCWTVLLLLGLSSRLMAAEFRVVHRFEVAGEPACMPALTRAPNGDLLAAFSTEWEPFPWGGVLKLVVSKDNAATWSKPRVIWKHDDPRVTIQVANGLQTLRNGDVLLPVTLGRFPKIANVPSEERRPQKIYDLKSPDFRREVFLLRSKDDGATWNIEDPKLPKPTWRFGRLLEIDDGRLLVTGMGWYAESRDFGMTWGQKREFVPNRFTSEVNVFEAADGTLFSIARGGGGPPRRTFGTNFSHDGGRTWGPPRTANVQGKMPDLLRFPSGRIVMAVGAEGLTDGSQVMQQVNRRSFCTLFISDDHGQSWKRDVALAAVDEQTTVVPGDSPVMCRLGEGKVLVVMQGMDRAKAGHPLMGYSAGMSLIGNVVELK